MIRRCAWCGRDVGFTLAAEEPGVTHCICRDCYAELLSHERAWGTVAAKPEPHDANTAADDERPRPAQATRPRYCQSVA